MASTNINIRIDSELKEQAESLFSDLGLSMTSAITIFLKSAVNSNGIPFELRRNIPIEETALATDTEKEKNQRNRM